MEPAIIAKIREHLAHPLRTECRVVYLLCEVRKLLDQQQPKPEPNALQFYCNWALHAELSFPRTTGVLLKRIDDFVINLLTKPETPEAMLDEDRLFREFLFLETFRKELAWFLGRNGLPITLPDQKGRWFGFLASYGGVIEDVPLTYKGKGLQMVDSVTFIKGRLRPDEKDSHVPFRMTWNIRLQDKRRVEVDVATQKDVRFRLHGITLHQAGQ